VVVEDALSQSTHEKKSLRSI